MKPRIINEYGVIYILSESGFYEPEAEPETRYAWRGIALYALAGLGALGAVYCLYEAWMAWPV